MNENEERIKSLEHEVSKIQGEALLYREKLEDSYRAARLAVHENNIAPLFESIPLPGSRVPSTEEARTWGKDFMHALEIDKRALETAKASLGRIQVLAGQLNLRDNDEYLRQEILIEIKRGLDRHV
jgi:hypothetical protein